MADAAHFTATANQGRITWHEPGKVSGLLARWNGQQLEITIQKHQDTRSLPQNKRYWGLIVPEVAGFLSEARGSLVSKEQAHYVLKSAFLGMEETALGPVPISTKTLSVEAFSAYCDRICAHAASEWGLEIGGEERRAG